MLLCLLVSSFPTSRWGGKKPQPRGLNICLTDDNNKFLQLAFKVMMGYGDLVYGDGVPGEGGRNGMAVKDKSKL